jgi:hypothetical protein
VTLNKATQGTSKLVSIYLFNSARDGRNFGKVCEEFRTSCSASFPAFVLPAAACSQVQVESGEAGKSVHISESSSTNPMHWIAKIQEVKA